MKKMNAVFDLSSATVREVLSSMVARTKAQDHGIAKLMPIEVGGVWDVMCEVEGTAQGVMFLIGELAAQGFDDLRSAKSL
jgi:hypothetical protein